MTGTSSPGTIDLCYKATAVHYPFTPTMPTRFSTPLTHLQSGGSYMRRYRPHRFNMRLRSAT